MSNEPDLVLTSSIPFVLVGASRDRFDNRNDQVLVRGGDAGIEFVGFVRQTEVTHESKSDHLAASPLLLTSRLRTSRGFRAVSGLSIPPGSEAVDQRHSTYVLAWKGAARASSEIEEQFNRSLPNILVGIEHNSELETEWALARVIFLVQDNEAKFQRRRRVETINILIYVIVAVALSIVVTTLVH